MLFSIEGVDGVGKSTVIEFLKEELKDEPKFIFTKEPKYLSNIEKRYLVRMSNPCTKLAAFWKDHIKHEEEFILPNLTYGKSIICDRGIYSRIAYQAYDFAIYHGISIRKSIDHVSAIHHFSRWPDKVFMIWSSYNLLVQRLMCEHDGMDITDLQKLLDIEDVYLEALLDGKCPYEGFNMEEGSSEIAKQIAESIRLMVNY